SAGDPRLKDPGGGTPFADLDRRAAVRLGGVEHPVVFPSAGRAQMDLRTTADWVLRPRLLKTSGIPQAVVVGGGRKQYQVLVDPTALTAHDVTLQQVEEALKQNNLNASGGYAFEGEEERPVRILGRLGPDPARVLRDLREVRVRNAPPRNIPLGQVARVG